MTDKQLLRAFAKQRAVEQFQPFLDRYLAMVFASACRQLDNPLAAAEATRAAFLALARRARSLSRRTVVAGWLFRATCLAARKLKRQRKRRGAEPALASTSAASASDDPAGARLDPILDKALLRLPGKLRDPVLLRFVLNWNADDTAATLRRSAKRSEKRARKGLTKLAKRIARQGVALSADALAPELASRASAVPLPAGLADEILSSAQACFRRRPGLPLARSILRGMTWARWKRLLRFAGAMALVAALVLGAGVWSVKFLWTTGRLVPLLIPIVSRLQALHHQELIQPATAWAPNPGDRLPSLSSLRSAADLYQRTNVWLAHLNFSAAQWDALRPSSVPPSPEILRGDGTITLLNPRARRNGLVGVLGLEFNWVHADLKINDAVFTNVACRFRGNGTYVTSLYGPKRSFKIELDKFDKQQKIAAVRTLNFNNLVEDRSYMHDALGYELFREAGVPSPRTAYAWITVSVPEQWEHKPLGLYLLLENPDSHFAAEHFGSSKAPIFKPVTPELFKDLGSDWSAYERIYDLKTKARPEQKQRIIDFAHLLTHASDAEFAARAGDYLDLDECARYLAALVLVANYDSLLTFGQNYYLYLDLRSEKLGFIPWDLDHAWGEFGAFGTPQAREHASIWHPWVGRNRFLERVMALEDFKRLYRTHLEELLATSFVPERLFAKIDQSAAVLRSAIAAESSFRLKLFDQATGTNWVTPSLDRDDGPTRPAHQLKRFIFYRAKSVRAQLDGKSKGIVLQNPDAW